MSREGFSDFVRALERSPGLRREVQNLATLDGIIELARQTGFPVSADDFKADAHCSKIATWFADSLI
ncbi:Nif11-like leader peptide family natural product precursor [Synechococcus sp. A10-1-5-9]|uniref:Nif11-like leader peptide family natural product precursor n=1 Tax=Synechococcus sp. A10-1-5-9 TaxID=3392295 RepID=UPI0039E898D7